MSFSEEIIPGKPTSENVEAEALPSILQTEMEETERSLRETTLMIEQSKGDVGKLTQRNAAITTHLQQLQKQGSSATVVDIQSTYESAMDAQQRLFFMRGQLDKLESDKTHLERHKSSLQKLLTASSQSTGGSGGEGARASFGMESIINAQEAERQRLSRQMHDGPAQALSNFILQTEIAMRLMDIDVQQARAELASLKATALGTFQKVRNFIFELRPMMLDDLGLVPTIKRYTETFKEQTGLEVNLVVTGAEKRTETFVEVMLFRAIQELLGNASRHSQATLVKVQIDHSENAMKVAVEDNGRGFDVDSLTHKNSLGLNLIKERVEMLGGKFDMDSAIGKGSRISFMVPAVSEN